MARLLMLSPQATTPGAALPALEFLSHHITVRPFSSAALRDVDDVDLLLIDARTDLTGARNVTRLARQTAEATPVVPIVTEGGLAALSSEWPIVDFLLVSAGPTEISARLRIALERAATVAQLAGPTTQLRASGVTVDESTYTAKVNGQPMNLTYKEFELLKFLVASPGRVFTREELLHRVWGYDYYGGTRTVDVHVRRLRAKLGSDHEQLIGTVRNVGYRFAPREGQRTEALATGTADGVTVES